MDKILASKDQEAARNRQTLVRLAVVGGSIALTVLAVILMLAWID